MENPNQTVTQPVKRHYLVFLLSMVCCVLIVTSYRRDDEYWLILGVAIQAVLLLHVCLQSRYLTGLGIAALVVYVLFIHVMLHAYVWPAADNLKRRVNLRDITQAFLKYGEDHKHFSRAAILDKQNQPLLSWRVELLPLLGYEELYQQFKLDEPWNSEHNIRLLHSIPEVYQPVGKRVPKGYTHTVVLRGPGSIFDEPTPPSPDRVAKADGLGMTVLLAETGRLIPWTRPEDEIVDPALPAPWLRAYPHRSTAYTFLSSLDGRVINLYEQYSDKTKGLVKIDARKLHTYVTWKGGEGGKTLDEPVDLEWP